MARVTTVRQRKNRTAVKSSRRKIAKKQVSDLKAQVMGAVSVQESRLKVDGKIEKAPMAPNPLRDAFLPPENDSARQDKFLTWALAAGVVLIIVLLVMGGKDGGSATPAMALHQIDKALKKGDMETLVSYIDEDRVATSVVDQFYSNPQLNLSQLPEDLRKRLPQARGQDIQKMIKPGLAELLKKNVTSFVEGNVDMENMRSGLFKRIWSELSGGKNLKYVGLRKIVADEKVAEVDILLERKDLNKPLRLSLQLENKGNKWVLVGLQNVQETMLESQILLAEMEGLDAVEPAVGPVDYKAPVFKMLAGDVLQIESARKISGTKVNGNKSILVTLKLRNVGPSDLKAFRAEVKFNDAAGRLMRSFVLSDSIGIDRGMRLEKTWRLPINVANRMEKHIYNLPQEAIQLLVFPKEVEMADGEIVKG